MLPERGVFIEQSVNVEALLRCGFEKTPLDTSVRTVMIELAAHHITRKHTSQVVFEPSTNNMGDKLKLLTDGHIVTENVTLQSSSSSVFSYLLFRSEGPDEPVPVLSVPGRRDVRHFRLFGQLPQPDPHLLAGP